MLLLLSDSAGLKKPDHPAKDQRQHAMQCARRREVSKCKCSRIRLDEHSAHERVGVNGGPGRRFVPRRSIEVLARGCLWYANCHFDVKRPRSVGDLGNTTVSSQCWLRQAGYR